MLNSGLLEWEILGVFEIGNGSPGAESPMGILTEVDDKFVVDGTVDDDKADGVCCNELEEVVVFSRRGSFEIEGY